MAGTPVGSPDFEEQAQWASNIVAHYTGQPALGGGLTEILPITPCAQWWGVQVTGTQTVIRLYLRIEWYADAAQMIFMGYREWTVQATPGIKVTVPNLGPYVRIVCAPPTAGTNNVDYRVVFTNRPGPPYSVVNNWGLAQINGLNVAATTTNTVGVNFPYSGPCAVWVYCVAASFFVAFFAEDANGNRTQFAHYDQKDGSARSIRDTLIIPPQVITIDLSNGDGVGQPFYVTAIPDMLRGV